MSGSLSRRQKEVLEVIARQMQRRGVVPSVREIGQQLGIRSPATVQQHLEALQQKGYIRRPAGHMRDMEILDKSLMPDRSEAATLPVVGRVSAGRPILAEEVVEDYLPVPRSMVGHDLGCFLLRVQGDSMIEAGIFEGDLVIVRPQPRTEVGEIVVALIEDEATVKRLARSDGRLVLQPANPRYRPIGGPFTVVGKVMGLLRRYSGRLAS